LRIMSDALCLEGVSGVASCLILKQWFYMNFILCSTERLHDILPEIVDVPCGNSSIHLESLRIEAASIPVFYDKVEKGSLQVKHAGYAS